MICWAQTSWVLVGHATGHDTQLFTDFARDRPERVAAIALRCLLDVATPARVARTMHAPPHERDRPQIELAIYLAETGRHPEALHAAQEPGNCAAGSASRPLGMEPTSRRPNRCLSG